MTVSLQKTTRAQAINVCYLGSVISGLRLWRKRSTHSQDMARGFTPQGCSAWCDSLQIEAVTMDRNKFGPND